MPSPQTLFLDEVRSLIPPTQMLTERDECLPFSTDWTRVAGQAFLVLFPKSTNEVASILKLAQKTGVAIVPSGGRTGLSGGAVAPHGEVVLSLTRMNRIGPVDVLGRSLRVEAGAITQAVHEHCQSEGLTWPIDLASKGSCSVGGNIATNAGGIRVVRYGMTRKWVSALQVVTAQGDILELNKNLEKNNCGYDLLQLFIGSEGTLGVVTEATLKLCPTVKESIVLLFALPSISDLGKLLTAVRKSPFELLAFEFYSRTCEATVLENLKKVSPFSGTHPFYALVEFETTMTDSFSQWTEDLLGRPFISESVAGLSPTEKKKLWEFREGITEAISQVGFPHGRVKKHDVALPVQSVIGHLETIVQQTKQYSGFTLYLFGHIADGSPHLNLVKPPEIAETVFRADCEKFEKWLFDFLKQNDGALSAEHGIGLLKKDWLQFSRSAAEMNLFRGLKNAFDPRGILNPGKVL